MTGRPWHTVPQFLRCSPRTQNRPTLLDQLVATPGAPRTLLPSPSTSRAPPTRLPVPSLQQPPRSPARAHHTTQNIHSSQPEGPAHPGLPRLTARYYGPNLFSLFPVPTTAHLPVPGGRLVPAFLPCTGTSGRGPCHYPIASLPPDSRLPQPYTVPHTHTTSSDLYHTNYVLKRTTRIYRPRTRQGDPIPAPSLRALPAGLPARLEPPSHTPHFPTPPTTPC